MKVDERPDLYFFGKIVSLSHCLLFVALFAAALPKLLGAAELHVCSTCGLNTNPGDALAPVRTIQRAADLAQPGDVISVAPGVYRERVAPPRGGKPDRPIVFRSQVRLQAIIKGSDVWEPLWRQEGGPIWSGEVSPDLFTDKRHVDGANPFEVALASTPSHG